MHACFHSIHVNYLCEIVWNCCMHNKCMSLYGNFTNDRISLVFWAPSFLLSKKALLHKPNMSSEQLSLGVNFFIIWRYEDHPGVASPKEHLYQSKWHLMQHILQREIYKKSTLISYIFVQNKTLWSCIRHFRGFTSCLACQHFDSFSTNWFSNNLHVSSI